jgi:hypothetical protein
VNDQLAVLVQVTRALDAAEVPYMLSGSVAMSCYAVPRMTRDVDIVVELPPPAVERLVSALGSDFYVDPEALRRAAERRSLSNAIHMTKLVKVDLIVRKDTPYRRGEFDRRRRLEIEGHPVWVVAAEDLLLSKLVWAKDGDSEVQRRDASALARSPEIDWAYLERWAGQLSVSAMLSEVRR